MVDYNNGYPEQVKPMQFKPNKRHEYRPEVTVGPHLKQLGRGRYVDIEVRAETLAVIPSAEFNYSFPSADVAVTLLTWPCPWQVAFKSNGTAGKTINWLVFDFKNFSVGHQLGVDVC